MKRLAISLALLLSTVAAGQQPAPASLEGFVVQSVTNNPLPATSVELRASWGVLSAVESGADGKFSFANVPAGTYKVVATRSAYVRGEYGQSKPGVAGTILNLRPGQQMHDLKIMLTPGGVITGRVTRNGVPQAAILIAAARITYDSGQPVLTTVLTAATDDLGEYHIFWLPPGQYYILADRDSNRPALPPPAVVINFGGLGEPLISRGANALVEMQRTFTNPGFDWGPGTKTLPDTEMYVPLYSPGTADRRTARVVDVAAGAVIDNININLTTAPALHVRGTVSGIPAAAQGQSIRPPTVALFSNDSPAGTPLLSVQADANGFFDLWRVRPGSYLLRAIANVSGNLSFGTAPIDVRDRDVSANITMEPGFTLTGKVSIERQSPLTPDPAIPNLTVRTFIERADGNISSNFKPSADGSFTIQNVTAGDHRMMFVRPVGMINPYNSVELVNIFRQERTAQKLEGAYVKSVKLGDEDVLNDGMHLTGPNIRPVMIVIGMDGGTIQGQVVNNRGEAQSGATVALIPESKLKFHIIHDFIVTDAAGKYEINSIAPGDYTIYAWDNVESGAWQNAEFLQKYVGTPVQIGPGGAIVHSDVTLSAEK